MDPFPPPPPPAGPELHPALWRAHQLGRPGSAVLPSGFALLDAELPGGGWPLGALTELLLAHPGVGELRLLAPALAVLGAAEPAGPRAGPPGRSRGAGPLLAHAPAASPAGSLEGAGRSLLLFDPPALPCAEAWAAGGLPLPQLVVVRQRLDGARGRARVRLPAADTLWALEQALKSGQAGAVLGWLPQRLPVDALRRLQLAAQAHPGPAFLFRDVEARVQPSVAPLRLLLAPGGPDELRVQLLKRRGPPLASPLQLALAPVLPEPLRARASRLRSPVPATVPGGAARPAGPVPASRRGGEPVTDASGAVVLAEAGEASPAEPSGRQRSGLAGAGSV